jgi:DNA-binding phage protein
MTTAALIRELAAKGKTKEQIAAKTGASRQAIDDALKRTGRNGRPPNPRCERCGQRLPGKKGEK